MATVLAWLLCALAIGGLLTTALSAWAITRLAARPAPHGPAEPVTLLKPLHGAEPGLARNLAGFLDQEWDAPIQMVAGVQRADDPARAVIASLTPSPGDRDRLAVVEILDPSPHGANAKIANLINMTPAARHELLVLSDDDMAVPRDYLAILAGALARPDVGAVTCLYRGRGVAGRWSVFSAAGTSYHFLPSVAMGLMLGIAKPCMGSTIALRRGTLERIGGFAAFADMLADDYAIGAAVRALGLGVAIPPILLIHDFPEDRLPALWRHEMRWHKTLQTVDPAGNAGLAFTYPLPFALLLIPLMPRFGAALLVVAFMLRLLLKHKVDRWAGAATCPTWMIPLRDCLSLALFVGAFFTRSVEWRGSALRMASKGRITATPESPRR